MVARDWGKEEWRVTIQWVQFQFCKMKGVLEMDGGEGCTTM